MLQIVDVQIYAQYEKHMVHTAVAVPSCSMQSEASCGISPGEQELGGLERPSCRDSFHGILW